MNFRVISRLLQRVVPAVNRGCEPACAPLVNSLIPADEQAGSPAPVESPARVEALVADLEAALSILREACENFEIRKYHRGVVCVHAATAMLKVIVNGLCGCKGCNQQPEPALPRREVFDSMRVVGGQPPPVMDVELALELASVVHEQCKDVPHDIGITLAEIVARRQPPTVGTERESERVDL